jgi:hypothetical protein
LHVVLWDDAAMMPKPSEGKSSVSATVTATRVPTAGEAKTYVMTQTITEVRITAYDLAGLVFPGVPLVELTVQDSEGHGCVPWNQSDEAEVVATIRRTTLIQEMQPKP